MSNDRRAVNFRVKKKKKNLQRHRCGYLKYSVTHSLLQWASAWHCL